MEILFIIPIISILCIIISLIIGYTDILTNRENDSYSKFLFIKLYILIYLFDTKKYYQNQNLIRKLYLIGIVLF